ncbi:MAG TPA: transposase [Pirellulaceae bacterium]|nr:transposase [Pirellulaceae bacterium]
MSKTSKPPRKVLEVALRTAQQSLPEYSHEFSPRKFTQHQLFACLVLKSFLKTDYRGVVEHLSDCASLREAIGLTKVPHFTTLQKAARRLLKRRDVDHLIGSTLKLAMGRKKTVKLAAIDSTGLQSRHCSSYYVKRRSREQNLWQTTT